MEDVFNNSK